MLPSRADRSESWPGCLAWPLGEQGRCGASHPWTWPRSMSMCLTPTEPARAAAAHDARPPRRDAELAAARRSLLLDMSVAGSSARRAAAAHGEGWGGC